MIILTYEQLFICIKCVFRIEGDFLKRYDSEKIVCDGKHDHNHDIESLKIEMPCEEELYDLAELFKVFGDTTRIKILYVLFKSEMCVCDIADALGMTQSAISHQLKVLKQARLVKSRREGKSIIYSLADGHVSAIIAQGQEHIEE